MIYTNETNISGPKCVKCSSLIFMILKEPKSLRFGSVPAKQNLQFVPYPVAASVLLQVCIIRVGKAVTTMGAKLHSFEGGTGGGAIHLR